MSTPTSQSVITDALTTFQGEILPIAAAALGVGVVVLAVRKGWKLAKSLLGL
jgi:hypothetical protein